MCLSIQFKIHLTHPFPPLSFVCLPISSTAMCYEYYEPSRKKRKEEDICSTWRCETLSRPSAHHSACRKSLGKAEHGKCLDNAAIRMQLMLIFSLATLPLFAENLILVICFLWKCSEVARSRSISVDPHKIMRPVLSIVFWPCRDFQPPSPTSVYKRLAT